MGNAGSFRPGPDPRRSGGRTKGSRNKATVARNEAEDKAEKELREQIDKDTTLPLQFMLRKMRNPQETAGDRFAAARAAAPYCHPQLTAIAHRHLDAAGNPIAPTVSVSIVKAPAAAPRRTHEGAKDDDVPQRLIGKRKP